MAKPKRMSEMFASSSEKNVPSTAPTATPPYSSDGPTLPIIETTDHLHRGAPKVAADSGAKTGKKRTAQDQHPSAKQPTNPSPHTLHPALYTPWTLLPPDLLKLLETQTCLRPAQDIVPVVFSKNQNVKSGINRLKTYLGAYRDPTSVIEKPKALKEKEEGGDVLIAVSAQGEGATKLVGIMDLVRRVVKPGAEKKNTDGKVETWWMYTVLSSVEVQRRVKMQEGKNGEEKDNKAATQEEEAFEPMDVEVPRRDGEEAVQMRKLPVLTVWLAKKSVVVFENAFGEQTFQVQRLPLEED